MTIADSDRTTTSWTQATTSGLLEQLEALLDRAKVGACDAECVGVLGKTLRKLHAKIRKNHASDHLGASDAAIAAAPELDDQRQRLRDEHQTIFGLIDRLVRSAEVIFEQAIEEQAVFFMRVRELVAVVRRHEAEEDRLFYLAVWRDTGGES